MALGTCSKCWDNPCTCGHDYQYLAAQASSHSGTGRDKRMDIASASLGVTKEFLEQMIGNFVSDKHPYEIVQLLKKLENYPTIERYVIDPSKISLSGNHPWAAERYVCFNANPTIPEHEANEDEEKNLMSFSSKLAAALQDFIFGDVVEDETIPGRVEAMKAAGYEVFQYHEKGKRYDEFWVVRLKNFVFQFA